MQVYTTTSSRFVFLICFKGAVSRNLSKLKLWASTRKLDKKSIIVYNIILLTMKMTLERCCKMTTEKTPDSSLLLVTRTDDFSYCFSLRSNVAPCWWLQKWGRQGRIVSRWSLGNRLWRLLGYQGCTSCLSSAWIWKCGRCTKICYFWWGQWSYLAW